MKTSKIMQLDTVKKDFRLSYLESVALGLLAFSKKFEFFRKRLMSHLFEHDFILSADFEMPEVHFDYEGIEWIPSIHQNVAESKLLWLLNEIEYVSEPERQRIVKIFSLAYKDPVPEMAAWGFIFNETLGVFVAGHPFNFDSCLEYSQVVILGSNWKKLKSEDLTKQVSMAGLSTINRCVKEAGVNFERLDPEVGSWLLEGSGVELYSSKEDQDFEEILNHLRNCGLPFTLISEEVNLIALQPSVTGSYETLLAKLTPL